MSRKSWGTREQMKAIGKRLRATREAKGLSQRQLSTEGVSPAYISRIEAGDRHPSLNALRLMADRLGVSVEYLETGEEPVLLPQEEIARMRRDVEAGRDMLLDNIRRVAQHLGYDLVRRG